MANLMKGILNWVDRKFSQNASKMIVFTGCVGWGLSSLAQIGALLVNPKISNEQKSYLVPQEFLDAVVNVGAFFLITQFTRSTVSKLFSTGKFAPTKVREFLNKNTTLKNKVGKIDFNLDDILKTEKDFPTKDYYACKNFGTAIATVGAGILSSNIITPIVRNNMAAKMQKNYIEYKSPKQNIAQPINYTTPRNLKI